MSNTKDKIVEAALALFNQKGLHDVGVREIARAMDISPGNLSYHFPRKEDLVNELLTRLRDDNDRCYTDFFAEPVTLLTYMRLLRRIYTNHLRYQCILVSAIDIQKNASEIGFDYSSVEQRRKGLLRKIFSLLSENGELEQGLPAANIEFLVSFMAFFNRFWLSEYALSRNHLPEDAALEHYLGLVARQLSLFASEKGKETLRSFLSPPYI